MSTDREMRAKEEALRRWFVRGCDPIDAEIDGLDIGWGGIQRWMTGILPLEECRHHLDFACGYATFVAQLAWRFPHLQIVGLNIDFEGPHAAAGPLTTEAGVAERCRFVQGDARSMPFSEASFDSVSCFLGLQDIEIGFGDEGVRRALEEADRVLKPGGVLAVAEEFTADRLRDLLGSLTVEKIAMHERALDVRWDRAIAERAIELYAQGYEAQVRSDDPRARGRARRDARTRWIQSMERQLAECGAYVPFGPVRLAVARKKIA